MPDSVDTLVNGSGERFVSITARLFLLVANVQLVGARGVNNVEEGLRFVRRAFPVLLFRRWETSPISGRKLQCVVYCVVCK